MPEGVPPISGDILHVIFRWHVRVGELFSDRRTLEYRKIWKQNVEHLAGTDLVVLTVRFLYVDDIMEIHKLWTR